MTQHEAPMSQGGRRTRWALALTAALVVVALAGWLVWQQAGPGGFATPDACLEAYRDTALAGDAEAFRRCLAEPLRGDGPAQLAEARRQLGDVLHWSQYAPEVAGGDATILVDQVRPDGMIHRVPYRLRRSYGSWLIASVGQPEIIRPPVRPGTHVGEPAGEQPPTPEP